MRCNISMQMTCQFRHHECQCSAVQCNDIELAVNAASFAKTAVLCVNSAKLLTDICKELAGILSVSESQLAKPTPIKKAIVGVMFCSSPSTPEKQGPC